MDPAETHWQGHRIAAAASLHKAAAGQGDSSQDRALVAREHTLAELWIPRRRIGKGPGQPPQLACTGRLQFRATQVTWSRDRALEAREHASRAVDRSSKDLACWLASVPREEAAARTCCLAWSHTHTLAQVLR